MKWCLKNVRFWFQKTISCFVLFFFLKTDSFWFLFPFMYFDKYLFLNRLFDSSLTNQIVFILVRLFLSIHCIWMISVFHENLITLTGISSFFKRIGEFIQLRLGVRKVERNPPHWASQYFSFDKFRCKKVRRIWVFDLY